MFENYVEGSYQLVPAPVAFIGQDGVVNDVNRAFLELLTCTVTDVVGRQLSDITRDPLSAGRIHEHTLHIGPVKGHECILFDRNRGEVPVSAFTTPMRNSQGSSAGYLLVVFDLRPLRRSFKKDPTRLHTEETLSNAQEQLARTTTARERAERALQACERTLNSVSQLTRDGVVLLQDGVIKYANRRFRQLWNAGPADVVGIQLVEYVNLDVLGGLLERSGQSRAEATSEPAVRTTLRRRDGSEIDVELNAGPAGFDGKPADLIIIRAAAGQKTVEPAPAPQAPATGPAAPLLFAVDREGRFTFRYATGGTQVLPENIFGKVFSEVLPPQASRLTAQALEKNQRKEAVEYEYPVPNGKQPAWFRTRLTPVLMNGEYAGSFAEVWDISERKVKERAVEIQRRNQELWRRIGDLQAALKQLRSFSSLLSGAEALPETQEAGELTAPVLSAEEYLAELPEDMRQQLARTNAQAEEMQHLIDSLLAAVQSGEKEAARIGTSG